MFNKTLKKAMFFYRTIYSSLTIRDNSKDHLYFIASFFPSKEKEQHF